MNNFYKILNLIILGILLLIFILYISMSKLNDKVIGEIKEAFQVSSKPDIQTTFFDISANFYNLTDSEKSQLKQLPLDEVILNIGGSFGEVDASKIPWDSENTSFTPGEALWGIVSQQASAALFNKVYSVSQLNDITKLQFNSETNKFSYQSPLFLTSANTPEEAARLEVAEQVVNLAYPIVFELLVRGELISGLKAVAGGVVDVVKGAARLTFRAVGNVYKSISKLVSLIRLTTLVQKNAAKGIQTAAVETATVSPKLLQLIDKIAKPFRHLKQVIKNIGSKISSTIIKAMSKLIGKFMGKLLLKIIIGSAITMVSLAAIPVVGPMLDVFYMVVILPIVMVLQMGGISDGALSKIADPEGCCPPNSRPLSEVIGGDAGELIISNIPIIGDVLSCYFPYLCSENGTGALVYKKTLSMPKWMNYSWLSCFYLDWPEYNCRIGGISPLRGKKFTGSGYNWNNELGVNGTYTDLSSVKENHLNYCQTIRKMANGKIDDSERKCILPANQKFFYADFSEPRMLIDMAQFYFKWATKSPVPNDDGTITVEHIRKINYVIASSLYSCDIMCEISVITYNPITGEDYSEIVTYDRDRRFYYVCDNSVDAPGHWEDYGNALTSPSNAYWRSLDDAYDMAVNDLNSYVVARNSSNRGLTASVLHTAYTLMLDASNRYNFISNITRNNLSNEIVRLSNSPININNLNGFVEADADVKNFLKVYTDANTNLNTIINKYMNSENNINVINNVRDKLAVITNASNAIQNYRYYDTNSISHPTNSTLVNNQYKLVGCTNIDGTGQCAINPDVKYLEEDSRYRCNFDVTPYFIRCSNVNMSISKCIDASNVELVIYNYLLQFPTKRIKTINSIKAKGVNSCEFIWDEITINPTTKIETGYKNNVKTEIVYQQDLSSCTFQLPPPTAISGTSNYLFGTQTGGTTSIQLAPTSLKMYTKPLSVNQPNYTANTDLRYKRAKFKYPVFTPPGSIPTSFVESNVDYIPRYDPATFTPMRDLVRPKKPIRIFYPGDDERTLGNYSNTYCSDPAMLQRFLLSYNGNSNNVNKITTIVRTFTSSSNTCDMEVDIIEPSTNNLKRITMTMNMVEGFQSSSRNNSNNFTYQSVDSSAGGLYIDRNTDSLSNPYQDGVNFNEPYLRSFKTDVLPFTSYFNDDLIKNFTDKTKSIRDNTNRLLVGLTGTRHLGRPPCNTKCQDGEVVQRIIEQYNKDGVASGRYGTEQNSVIQVLNSATNSSNTCHVLLQNKNEVYGDFYLDEENKKNSSNYYSENRLKFKKVQMEDAGNCTFYPVPNQIYQDISASDLALSSSRNFNTYITPKRSPCNPVDCGNPDLYRAAMLDYTLKTGNPITYSNAYMNIGLNKCDYLIKTDIRLDDGRMISLDMDFVLRVSYDAPLYNNTSTANCISDPNYIYSYSENNFVLQVEEDLSELVSNPEYYQLIEPNSSYISPLQGEIDSRLIGKVHTFTSE